MRVWQFRNGNLCVDKPGGRRILVWNTSAKRVSYVPDTTTRLEYDAALRLLRNRR